MPIKVIILCYLLCNSDYSDIAPFSVDTICVDSQYGVCYTWVVAE